MTHRFLSTPLRKTLEKDIKKAREIAEDGAAAAISRLGVAETAAPAHLNEDDKAARRRLRAHARALGDEKTTDGGHNVTRLIEATAYAQWHRRLFARFLAERNLLRHPLHGVAVTLDDAEELASEEGYADGWSAAEAYAARMLPAVFQPDDPVLVLALAPEHEQALRKLVLGLDAETFQTDDALGWSYQYWRALEKERVNQVGGKIGAHELPAVTQLFTEPYMVQFLLHNTLGAWRAGKVLAARPDLAADAADEATLRAAVSPPGYAFNMLRFTRDGKNDQWRPSAGAFPNWPDTAAAIRSLDPCCGSGHFLTETLTILSALRADEEGLSNAEAVAAVLRDNLFGLELDGRCVQIAAFAVALTAWRIGGFQPFEPEQVHIAWVGAPPPLDRNEFLALGNEDEDLRAGLAGLYDLFIQAPLLGSLIDPVGGDLMSPQRLGQIDSLLDRLVAKTRAAEPEWVEGAIAARGMAGAAAILSQRYTLVATNVPFLGRGKQHPVLAAYIERNESDAKADLATAIFSRSLRLLNTGGSAAIVAPQTWLFLKAYKDFRVRVLINHTLNLVADLGPAAFRDMNWWAARTALTCFTLGSSPADYKGLVLDADTGRDLDAKEPHMRNNDTASITQEDQISNPDSIISTRPTSPGTLLSSEVEAFEGMSTGDNDRYRFMFWEVNDFKDVWSWFLSTNLGSSDYSGRQFVVRWEKGSGSLALEPGARIQGSGAWNAKGFSLSVTGQIRSQLKEVVKHEKTTVALIPRDQNKSSAIYCFLRSPEYVSSVRALNQKTGVSTGILTKVPFDLERWEKVAADQYSDGLPEPYSDDPTQWIFHGHPAQAEPGTQLHVALARLAGYRWPAESDPDMGLSIEAKDWIAKAAILPDADADGVLPLTAVAGDRPLADRLREYLNVAIPNWDEAKLVREADERIDKKAGRDLSLEAWLNDRAFRQHSALFRNRPFLWHVWDGQKDGFAVFLYSHRLDHATLQKLTYTLLGAWIARREAEKDGRRVEAAKILQKTLEAILVGEAPYDIFVRWKSLAQEPMGWNPDLDDGVRLNIRPWVNARILRDPLPKGIKWGVDRGADVSSAPWFKHDKGKRDNDRHTTLAEKRDAREAANRKVKPT